MEQLEQSHIRSKNIEPLKKDGEKVEMSIEKMSILIKYREALRFFMRAELSQEEQLIFRNYFDDADFLKCGKGITVPSISYLIDNADPETLIAAHERFKFFRNIEEYKSHIKSIIDEIGIDNLYEIIDKLDGKK